MGLKWSLTKHTTQIIFLLVCPIVVIGQSNTWKPAMQGIKEFTSTTSRPPRLYKNGPNDRPWLVGSFLDEDSIYRVAAYWEDQRWKPLPLKFDRYSFALSMTTYGDTTYIGGGFEILQHDSSSQPLNVVTSVIKLHQDSIWFENPARFFWPEHWTAQDDTLIALNTTYFGANDTIGYLAMTDDGGASWRYPFTIPHPTYPARDPSGFGILTQARISNGDIYITNNGDSLNSPFRGVARWDGQQWHSLGMGTPGFNSKVWALEFFQGDLYIGGSFNKRFFPNDPGVHFARWDGQQWHSSGNPVDVLVSGLVKDDSVLYAISRGDTFGDIRLPKLAAWDGSKWCGTPTNFQIGPTSIAPLQDTMLLLFSSAPIMVNGVQMPQLIYFDGDYLNGPNSICSSANLGQAEDLEPDQRFSIFPNPCSDLLFIQTELPSIIENVKLYSLQGTLIKEWQFDQGFTSVKLAQLGLSEGLYLIQVNNIYVEKLRVR